MVKRKANSSPVQDTFEGTELPVNIVVVKCGLAAKIIKDNATLPLDVTAFDRQCCNCSKIHQVCLCIETKKGSIYWCAECRSNAIYNKIQQDVREMSSLFVEASIYIHYSLKKRWQNGNFEPIKFSDYYYPLMQKKRVDKYILDAECENLRGTTLPFYDSAYRPNLFIDSANQYSTIFHNNIWMHAYTRLRKFFKHFESDSGKIYRTLAYLFETNTTKIPDGELLKKLQTELQWNGEKLTELKLQSKYWKSMY